MNCTFMQCQRGMQGGFEGSPGNTREPSIDHKAERTRERYLPCKYCLSTLGLKWQDYRARASKGASLFDLLMEQRWLSKQLKYIHKVMHSALRWEQSHDDTAAKSPDPCISTR